MASVADNLNSKTPWTSLSSTDRTAAESSGFNQRSWTAEIGPSTAPTGGGNTRPPDSKAFQLLGKLAQDRIPKTETTVGEEVAPVKLTLPVFPGTGPTAAKLLCLYVQV